MEKGQRDEQGCTQRSEDGDESSSGCSGEVRVRSQNGNGQEKPYVGMVFESEEACRNFYDAYATKGGFSTSVSNYSRAKPDGPIVSWEYTCSGDIFKRKNNKSCGAMLKIDKQGKDSWIVTKFVEGHNHSCPSNMDHLGPRKHFVAAAKNVQDSAENQNDSAIIVDGDNGSYDPNLAQIASPVQPNITVRNAEQVTVFRNVDPLEVNRATVNIPQAMPVHFFQTYTRKRTLGKDAQNLVSYFQKMQADNPGFYYAVQLNDQNRLTNVFWADARSRTAYGHFGDVVTFDTMYRPNQFQVPFAPFTGVNNHGHTVLFGCALLFDESEASFAWVFTTWLSAMNNKPPVSITTDQDRVIKAAVDRVFPKTRHCICKWHILREGQERLSYAYRAYPSLSGELYNCIIFSETVEDFESSWSLILDKYYDLRKNGWLQAVYNARKQWVPVYFRNTFFAALTTDNGASSFFEGFVNQQTTLPSFFQVYERALGNSLKREIDADFDTICTTPVLKTPSPMEQQAANLYTKMVFSKFQEELVETFVYTANKVEGNGTVSKFRVAKYEHNDRAYVVTFDVSEMKASCSCRMFEYVGVLCRHILTVFTVTNVLTIPLHYILKRWTCNARSGFSDEQETNRQCGDSLTMRFNNLCREALKFAEEGAIAPETYTACMEALREGAKKVSVVKGNIAKSKSHSSQRSTNFEDNGRKKAPALCSDAIPSTWSWKDTTPSQVNLNDAGTNYPTMAPLAINRDGSLADNTVVLACFKSMTWVIENKNPKVAVINLKLQDYGKALSGETEVQFGLTRDALEPMLKSMSYISQQLSIPANKVAVMNLKLHGTKTTTGETEVKFQVNRDTLASMLRSMAFIREHL